MTSLFQLTSSAIGSLVVTVLEAVLRGCVL